MSGKPAARVSDPTACPIPGHGVNPIAAGSPNVLFDGLAAARMGDASACGGKLASAVIPTVLINGKPATTLGSVGSHGNVVIAGSGTVLIGTSGGGAAFTPVAALAMAATAPAAASGGGGGGGGGSSPTITASPAITADSATDASQASNTKQEFAELDYRLSLKSGGNHLLTPLEIPDYDEIATATTNNKEGIDFLIVNRKQAADSMTLEVFDGSTLLHSETDTSTLLPKGEHSWQWDGYNMLGVLDTKALKSSNLRIRLTAHKGSQQQISELSLDNSAEEVDWIDAHIDRNAMTIELTLRPSFTDGGITGKNAKLTALTFAQLELMAKAGIEHYWSRNSSRTQGIGAAIQTTKGAYKVTVVAELNAKPCAKKFPLIEALDADFGRSTSFAMFKKIYHNQGFWHAANYPAGFADDDFAHTAAHELGHLILNEYGDGGLIPKYSWSHKQTSTVLTQSPVDNHPISGSGELDLMHYHSDYPQGPKGYQDYWDRSVASEQDVKSLLWLSRVKFND